MPAGYVPPTPSTAVNPFTFANMFSSGECGTNAYAREQACSLLGATTTVLGGGQGWADKMTVSGGVADALKSGTPEEGFKAANALLDAQNSAPALTSTASRYADGISKAGKVLGPVGFAAGVWYNYNNDQNTYNMSKTRAAVTSTVQGAVDYGISVAEVGEATAIGCGVGGLVGCAAGAGVGLVLSFAESNIANNLIADVSNWLF